VDCVSKDTALEETKALWGNGDWGNSFIVKICEHMLPLDSPNKKEA